MDAGDKKPMMLTKLTYQKQVRPSPGMDQNTRNEGGNPYDPSIVHENDKPIPSQAVHSKSQKLFFNTNADFSSLIFETTNKIEIATSKLSPEQKLTISKEILNIGENTSSQEEFNSALKNYIDFKINTLKLSQEFQNKPRIVGTNKPIKRLELQYSNIDGLIETFKSLNTSLNPLVDFCIWVQDEQQEELVSELGLRVIDEDERRYQSKDGRNIKLIKSEYHHAFGRDIVLCFSSSKESAYFIPNTYRGASEEFVQEASNSYGNKIVNAEKDLHSPGGDLLPTEDCIFIGSHSIQAKMYGNNRVSINDTLPVLSKEEAIKEYEKIFGKKVIPLESIKQHTYKQGRILHALSLIQEIKNNDSFRPKIISKSQIKHLESKLDIEEKRYRPSSSDFAQIERGKDLQAIKTLLEYAKKSDEVKVIDLEQEDLVINNHPVHPRRALIHIDYFVTAINDSELVIGKLPKGHPEYDFIEEIVSNTKKNYPHIKIKRSDIPTTNDGSLISYHNTLVEHCDQVRKIYIPQYFLTDEKEEKEIPARDINELNQEAVEQFKDLFKNDDSGYKTEIIPIPIPLKAIVMYRGSLHCLTRDAR